MALNKAGIKVSVDEYWNEWGIKETQSAVGIAGFDKATEDWIWKTKRSPFEVF